MLFKASQHSPLLYDKNRKTFMLILSTLIGLLYLMAMAGNGIRGFISGWTTDPDQECYIIIPYSGNAAQLKIDAIKIEEYLKKSPLVKNCNTVAEADFQKMFTSRNQKDSAWIESIPLPVFIEVRFHKTSNQIFELIEKQISEIVTDAQIHTQLRYSAEFIASLKVLIYIINGISMAISLVIFAVIAMMIKGLFAQQEHNIEKLALLGAPYDYINKLYCQFTARCIIISSAYGFLSAIIIVSSICAVTENMDFFPYGFAIPSWALYIGIPLPCLAIGLCMTYFLVNSLQKRHFACV